MLWGRKRPRERTPVVWRQDAFPFFYSIWESARGSVFWRGGLTKRALPQDFFFWYVQYSICGRFCQGEVKKMENPRKRGEDSPLRRAPRQRGDGFALGLDKTGAG